MIIKEEINGTEVECETGEYYFSPKGVDRGTRLMLETVPAADGDKVLDLGCGYGVVGIYAAKKLGGEHVVMCDVLEEAVTLSKANLTRNGIEGVRVLQSDGLRSIEDRDFTLILSNPPYHTDFSVAREFIEDGFKKLKIGGRMALVTKRLDWYRNKLKTVFGGVKVFEKEDYYIFLSEKRTPRVEKEKKTKTLSKKLQRKYGNKGKNGK
ncbi:MAG: class I SAM-dependent methyltransferase [Lachnospiraceae bacterium]|nr:class I SAM-dependent methyltransferase [Lachnospiraceae bacterium]